MTAFNSNIIGRVAALPTLESAQLKDLWQELYSEPAPKKKREYLIPRLAYKMQELEYGGLELDDQKEINNFIKNEPTRPTKNKRIHMPKVGTKLIREYKGKEHQVTVTRTGFEYQGRTFKSLSQIATAITGTRWNGPLFFGLTSKPKKP